MLFLSFWLGHIPSRLGPYQGGVSHLQPSPNRLSPLPTSSAAVLSTPSRSAPLSLIFRLLCPPGRPPPYASVTGVCVFSPLPDPCWPYPGCRGSGPSSMSRECPPNETPPLHFALSNTFLVHCSYDHGIARLATQLTLSFWT